MGNRSYLESFMAPNQSRMRLQHLLLLATIAYATALSAITAGPSARARAVGCSSPRQLTRLSVTRRALSLTVTSVPLVMVRSAHAGSAMDELSGAKALTIGQYMSQVREARRGLEELQTLLELGEERGNEAFRIALRKPPVSGLRKACSKVILELEGASMASSKQRIYTDMKASLAALDDGARPGLQKKPAEMVAELNKLESLLDTFGKELPQ